MKRQSIEDSSNVKSVGYDPETDILEIEYKDSGIYQYDGVSKRAYTNLLRTDSPGSYIHRNLIPKHKGRKI